MIHDPSVKAQARDLIVNLRMADEETGGHPVLPPEHLGLARDYLEWLLLDPIEGMKLHIELLEALYKARFRVPLPRRMRVPGIPGPTSPHGGFRHMERLPEAEALAVLDHGLAALPATVLPRLLLNPYA